VRLKPSGRRRDRGPTSRPIPPDRPATSAVPSSARCSCPPPLSYACALIQAANAGP